MEMMVQLLVFDEMHTYQQPMRCHLQYTAP